MQIMAVLGLYVYASSPEQRVVGTGRRHNDLQSIFFIVRSYTRATHHIPSKWAHSPLIVGRESHHDLVVPATGSFRAESAFTAFPVAVDEESMHAELFVCQIGQTELPAYSCFRPCLLTALQKASGQRNFESQTTLKSRVIVHRRFIEVSIKCT